MNRLDELYKNAVRQGLIHNGGRQCDTWDGPCACGAWHNLTEAEGRLKANDFPLPPPKLRLVKGGDE